MKVNILLFDGFETLDAFGPVEILDKVRDSELHYCSQYGGIITSAQHTEINTESIAELDRSGILLVPGGMGTRTLISDSGFIAMLRDAASAASYCLTVCTGSALLAQTGLLNGRHATSNKIAFDWVTSITAAVEWEHCARWVRDGKYYTSSGVSAGMDMALGFIRDTLSERYATEIARHIEYIWNSDPAQDIFAV